MLVSAGARDQTLIARLSGRLGAPAWLLIIGCISAALSAAVMAFAGGAIAGFLALAGKQMLVAMALVLAAVELAWNRAERALAEPTRSFFAIFAVLVMRQLGDGARFLIFAIAVATPSPLAAGVGGALGGMAALCAGWALGDDLEARLPLRPARRGLAALLLAAGIFAALNARGLIG
ncbi:hypothetical protein [Altererythrobacter aquiaggeris]|uniref:hypothetical protein n=1 Tax=Aestuarierythrobacter aquiaggeris TaxID=1898396 RepID=UPI003015EE25